MNIKVFSILLFTLLWAGCTDESALTDPLVDNAPRREVLLTLQNKLSLGNLATRADSIATLDENRIDSLDIYVFGCDSENGTYTYQERFSYRSNDEPVPGAGKLTLRNSDLGTMAVFRPKKGVYSKVYCVANRGTLYQPDGRVPVFTPLEPATGIGAERVPFAPGSPLESTFLTYRTELLAPLGTPNVRPLLVPLPMAGACVTPIDLTDLSASSRQNISITLTRLVARFDITNVSEKSKFTLESISLGKGRPAVRCFPVKATGDSIPYPERTFSFDEVNTGTMKGAYYTYPSPVSDGAFLNLKGTYAKNQHEDVPVSYSVPFKQYTNGIGAFIEITENHRYQLEITEADLLHAQVTIRVLDWLEGDKLDDFRPDNGLDSILFEDPTHLNTYDRATRSITMDLSKGSSFTLTTASMAGVEAITSFAEGEPAWFEQKITPEVPSTKGGKQKTVFTFQFVDAALTFTDAQIILRDKTGTVDSTLVVHPKATVPVVKQKGGSGSNSLKTDTIRQGETVTLRDTMTLYLEKNGYLTFTAGCGGGNELKNVPDWITATPSYITTSSGDYTFKLNTLTVPEQQVNFQLLNTAQKEREREITIQLKLALVDSIRVDTTLTKGTVYDAANRIVTMKLAKNSAFILGAKAPSGVNTRLNFGNEGNDAPWFEQVVSNGRSAAIGNTYQLIATADTFPPAKITLSNKVEGGPDSVIQVNPLYEAPQITAFKGSGENAFVAADPKTGEKARLELMNYNSKDSVLSLSVTSWGGSELEGLPAGTELNIEKDPTDKWTDIYTFSIIDSEKTVSGTTDLKLYNDADPMKLINLLLVIGKPEPGEILGGRVWLAREVGPLSFNEMMAIDFKGVCPSAYHVPSILECEAMGGVAVPWAKNEVNWTSTAIDQDNAHTMTVDTEGVVRKNYSYAKNRNSRLKIRCVRNY